MFLIIIGLNKKKLLELQRKHPRKLIQSVVHLTDFKVYVIMSEYI